MCQIHEQYITPAPRNVSVCEGQERNKRAIPVWDDSEVRYV